MNSDSNCRYREAYDIMYPIETPVMEQNIENPSVSVQKTSLSVTEN